MIALETCEGLPPPHPSLARCVVVPARNEEKRLPRLIDALAGQRDLAGAPLPPDSFEVLLLLNNCTDRTASVARALQRKYPALRLRVAEVSYPPADAHVGKARQTLFETAFRRFASLSRTNGLILSTDADSRPALDWIAQNEAEIALGVEGVGGRVVLETDERAALTPGVRRLFLLDIGYRRALEELRSLHAPETHDPFPRHHQHFGASLCVTAAAYARAGGMPLQRSNEDVALYRAILSSGGRFRHSDRVRVFTSGREDGRAQKGLADAVGWWRAQVEAHQPIMVESAEATDERLAELGRWQREHQGQIAPFALSGTPEPPPPHRAEEIQATLRLLRERIAALRPLLLACRTVPVPQPDIYASALASLAS